MMLKLLSDADRINDGLSGLSGWAPADTGRFPTRAATSEQPQTSPFCSYRMTTMMMDGGGDGNDGNNNFDKDGGVMVWPRYEEV